MYQAPAATASAPAAVAAPPGAAPAAARLVPVGPSVAGRQAASAAVLWLCQRHRRQRAVPGPRGPSIPHRHSLHTQQRGPGPLRPAPEPCTGCHCIRRPFNAAACALLHPACHAAAEAACTPTLPPTTLHTTLNPFHHAGAAHASGPEPCLLSNIAHVGPGRLPQPHLRVVVEQRKAAGRGSMCSGGSHPAGSSAAGAPVFCRPCTNGRSSDAARSRRGRTAGRTAEKNTT